MTQERRRRADTGLKDDLLSDLRRMNPWWEGQPARPSPPTRRHLVRQIQRRLDAKIAPIVVVRGPRQIGKSTAQMQVLEDLLNSGVNPLHVFRVQFDDLRAIDSLGQEPILRLIDWYERDFLGVTLNRLAQEGGEVRLFLDEVQNLPDWDVQLKALVDSTMVRVVVTGSSALRIERGRDSLAGRISTLEAGTLSLTEIASFRGIPLGDPLLVDNGTESLGRQTTWEALRDMGRARATARDQAFEAFSLRGGYPLVHQRAEVDWSILADQLNETVIRRVIEHDLRVGEVGRKRDAKLLEELFRLACRYAGQAPGVSLLVREAQRALAADVGTQRVRDYMKFLGDTLLLRVIEPLEIRLKKMRGAPKLCLADHALRASWLHEEVPLAPDGLRAAPDLTTLAGHLAESVVGATLSTIHGLDLNWRPERGDEPEIDFVLTIGTMRIPLEVKY